MYGFYYLVQCGEETYTCEDGRLCLHMNLVCNGKYNCPDGDDESEEACELKSESLKILKSISLH